jgi:hypothetical protein
MPKSINWDDALSDRVLALWKSKSATEIVSVLAADGYSLTRNSVMGRIYRMGGSVKSKSDVHPNTTKAAEQQRPKINRSKLGLGAQIQSINRGPKVKVEKFKARAADVVSLRKPILELQAMECRWPDEHRNEAGLHTFCGNPTLDGHSYCEAHQFIAIDQARMAKVRAARKNMERAAA